MASDNYIWIGPTIPRLAIRKNMLILGPKAPPQLKNLMDTKPMYRSLFIPTERLEEARRNLRVRGSLEQLSTAEITATIKDKRGITTVKEEGN